MIDEAVIGQLSCDIGDQIEVCFSWGSLMAQLYNMSSLEIQVPVILVDIGLFLQKDATVSEIVSMLSTLHRCFDRPVKMHLGVVVEHNCTAKELRELQELDIDGIVPCSKRFGV